MMISIFFPPQPAGGNGRLSFLDGLHSIIGRAPDNLAHKRKPEPGAAVSGWAIELMERFEGITQTIRRDADACICDRDNDEIFLRADADHHARLRG
jgi:hypothetical protein